MLVKILTSIIEKYGFDVGIDLTGRLTIYWDVKGSTCHVGFLAWFPTTELPRLIPVMFQDGNLIEAAHLKAMFDASTVTIEIDAKGGLGERLPTIEISGLEKASDRPELDVRAVNALRRAVMHLSKEACDEAAQCLMSYWAVARVDSTVVYQASTRRFQTVVEKCPVEAHVHDSIYMDKGERSAAMLQRIVKEDGIELFALRATLYKKRDDQEWQPVSQALVKSVLSTRTDNWAEGHVAGVVKAAIRAYRKSSKHTHIDLPPQ